MRMSRGVFLTGLGGLAVGTRGDVIVLEKHTRNVGPPRGVCHFRRSFGPARRRLDEVPARERSSPFKGRNGFRVAALHLVRPAAPAKRDDVVRVDGQYFVVYGDGLIVCARRSGAIPPTSASEPTEGAWHAPSRQSFRIGSLIRAGGKRRPASGRAGSLAPPPAGNRRRRCRVPRSRGCGSSCPRCRSAR